MYSDYKRLAKYFEKKYQLSPLEANQYVADELGTTIVHLLDVMLYRVVDTQLDKAARDTVDILLPDK